MKSTSPDILLKDALNRTKTWFPAVQAIIQQTSLEEVWGTALYDRDPMPPRKKTDPGSRVVVIGDAAHPMSMFKGQGANQAIGDGPLLASWLCQGKEFVSTEGLMTKLRCFEREMIDRTSSKVLASRDAAKRLHSPQVFQGNQTKLEHETSQLAFSFEGVPMQSELHYKFMQRLHETKISANLGASLDGEIAEVLKDLKREFH